MTTNVDLDIAASLIRRDPTECKTCSYLANTVGEPLTSDTTDAQIASSLDDACAELSADTGCQSFLDAHGDELVTQLKNLGDDSACLEIEACTFEELGDVHDGN